MPIINSLLDTDFYIFTMAQAIYHQYPNVTAKFRYKNRSVDKDIRSSEFITALCDEIDYLCSLRFKESEIQFLKNTGYFKDTFLDFLRGLKLNRNYIRVDIDYNPSKKRRLHIIIEGPLSQVIWFEVPVLAIINELNNNLTTNFQKNYYAGLNKLNEKISYLVSATMWPSSLNIIEFGTRRRNSYSWHRELTKRIKDKGWYKGTSNVLLSKIFGLEPKGTMAHLWFQLHQQIGVSLEDSQKVALQRWMDEYRGELGIALSDIGGFDWFLKDFDLYFAKLYDGCRHDSGNSFEWCWKLIDHYKKLGIDPKSKIAFFSDGLDFKTVIDLYRTFSDSIQLGFGIGTYLTNDVYIPPQQIVIKMVECNGKPVAKLSDSKGKGMCEDPKFEKHFRNTIRRAISK